MIVDRFGRGVVALAQAGAAQRLVGRMEGLIYRRSVPCLDRPHIDDSGAAILSRTLTCPTARATAAR